MLSMIKASHPSITRPRMCAITDHGCAPSPIFANLEGESCREHEHQDELKVLVDGPKRLHCPVGVRNKEVESRGRQDLVAEEEPA